MPDDILLTETSGPVMTLTLNRPAARNALSLEMIAALREAVGQAAADRQVHVVILAASGPVFCAGHDLKELTAARASDDRGRAFFERTMRGCSELMLAITRCPKPVIARVQGTATAAGCQLVATCDLAISAETAHFATPGVDIGLFCSTPMVALTRNVGRKQAMEMLLTGRPITAAEAEARGLINRAVPAGQLAAETDRLARLIAGKAPRTLTIGKRAFYDQVDLPLAQAYDHAAEVMIANMLERDAEEGIGAFIEKRAPGWAPLD